jgi:hypothetical protein
LSNLETLGHLGLLVVVVLELVSPFDVQGELLVAVIDPGVDLECTDVDALATKQIHMPAGSTGCPALPAECEGASRAARTRPVAA